MNILNKASLLLLKKPILEPNTKSIGVADLRPFEVFFQNGRRPPSWI